MPITGCLCLCFRHIVFALGPFLKHCWLLWQTAKNMVLKASTESSSRGQACCQGERQQVFANSNTVYHTLHYTFLPFLWVSATLNIFHTSDIFLVFHLFSSLIKMPPGKLLLTLQDPAQIIAPSEACCYPISHPQVVIIFFGSHHTGYRPEAENVHHVFL